jgi:hypothetical protein
VRIRRRSVEAFLTLKGPNIPFVNNVKYLGLIFDKKITRIIHIETMATKTLRIFISICPILKSERSSVNTKLTLYKALIRSILTYACPAWEFAAVSYLLELWRLQNKVLRTTGNLPRSISTSDLHVAFKSPHLYDFVTKLCRPPAAVILNHNNVNVRNIC